MVDRSMEKRDIKKISLLWIALLFILPVIIYFFIDPGQPVKSHQLFTLRGLTNTAKSVMPKSTGELLFLITACTYCAVTGAKL